MVAIRCLAEWMMQCNFHGKLWKTSSCTNSGYRWGQGGKCDSCMMIVMNLYSSIYFPTMHITSYTAVPILSTNNEVVLEDHAGKRSAPKWTRGVCWSHWATYIKTPWDEIMMRENELENSNPVFHVYHTAQWCHNSWSCIAASVITQRLTCTWAALMWRQREFSSRYVVLQEVIYCTISMTGIMTG